MGEEDEDAAAHSQRPLGTGRGKRAASGGVMGAIDAAWGGRRGQDAAAPAPKEPLQAPRGNKAIIPGIYKLNTQLAAAGAAALLALYEQRRDNLED